MLKRKSGEIGEMDGCEHKQASSGLQTSLKRKLPKNITAGWRATGLDAGILLAVGRLGYKAPTPIQRAAIPALMDGRDVVAMARTGSGKTAAFLLPMLHKLRGRDGGSGARGVIVSPTRELALQTFRCVKQLGKHTGLRAAVVVGGDSLEDQFGALHNKPDIIVATPGRLMHLVIEMDLQLSSVQMIVFDEADRLFELGFSEQLHNVLKRLPDHKQVALFSATIPKMLADFASSGLTDPLLIRKDTVRILPEKLQMAFIHARSEEKIAVYGYLLRNVLKPLDGEQTIVFCATKHFVEYLTMVTEALGFPCTYLYSSLDPLARQAHMARFAGKQCNVLIVTDVAARGVDLPLLDNVLNFHFPPRPKLFVHRVGRAARAGRSGRAISLVSSDELPYLLDLSLFLGRSLEVAGSNADGKQPDEAECCLLGALRADDLSDALDVVAPVLRSDDADLAGQRKTAANSMLHYARTRPQPSGESVRRAKKHVGPLVASAGVHPMLGTKKVPVAEEELYNARENLLDAIRHYKPNATIFEVGTSSKSVGAVAAKAARRAHAKRAGKLQQAAQLDGDQQTGEAETTAAVKNVDQPASFVKPTESTPQRKKKPPVSRKQEKYFVQYVPKGLETERGLQVEKSEFARAANEAIVDFTADDQDDMHRNASVAKRWDRKKKKFVGPSEMPNSKTIRLDDGSRVPASLKSGRYDRWRRRHRLDVDAGAQPPDPDAVGWGHRNRRSRNRDRFIHGEPQRPDRKGEAAAGAKGGQSKKRVRLRPKEQILKQRKRKAAVQSYQKHRHHAKGKPMKK